MNKFDSPGSDQSLASAIVDTIREPFLLDDQFRVLAASRSFYQTFQVHPDQTIGCLLYALGDGQWDIPALRLLLETTIPEHVAMDGFEVEHDFPGLGARTMVLNARMVILEDRRESMILLAFEDITDRRGVEREKQGLLERTEALLDQRNVLLQEMQHRVANSLQIIASILMLKARAVSSEETRQHLSEAHQRVMSVAAVQTYLHQSEGIGQIDARSYLTKLCEGLASSMVGENQPIAIVVTADAVMIESAQAVSIGLIVTELVINAIKYAFPSPKADARMLIGYETNGADWKLSVSDNGCGKPTAAATNREGLGTAIVKALTKQLGASLQMKNGPDGLSVSITRATFTSHLPIAA